MPGTPRPPRPPAFDYDRAKQLLAETFELAELRFGGAVDTPGRPVQHGAP